MATSIMRQTNSEGTYTFSSQPRAVTQRKKYRPSQEDEVPVLYGNIMYDKRVIRGNTYSQHIFPTSAGTDPVELQKQQQLESRRHKEQAGQRRRRQQQQQHRLLTPGPVEGRRHIDVQTELYLEELSDRVEEVDVECQTDEFLDRAPSPLFIPAKTGLDCGTQIEPGELFDFNVEVTPILEVLIGKTVEQALVEVMEEEELAAMREQQKMFEELRNAELAECQRLEEQDRRRRDEKERRMKEASELARSQKETADKIAAHAFAQSYMADLVPAVFSNLERHGYFYDATEREVERDFLPWLEDEVEKRLNTQMNARRIVDSLIREVTMSRRNIYDKLQQRELEEEREREREEEKENPADTEEENDADGEVKKDEERDGDENEEEGEKDTKREGQQDDNKDDINDDGAAGQGSARSDRQPLEEDD